MPRTKKLNLGERVTGAGKGARGKPRKRVKDLTSNRIDNTEEIDEPTTFESEIEIKEVDDLSDLIKQELIKYRTEDLTKKEQLKKAKEEEKLKKQAEKEQLKKAKEEEKEQKKKAREEEEKKYREEQKQYFESIIAKTILQRDKSILMDKLHNAKTSRGSNLNF